MEEVASLKYVYFLLGQCLNLQEYDLKAIRETYPNEYDNEKALSDVILLWLHQKYNVDSFGPPTWKMLAEAVHKLSGRNNTKLAKIIASKHPARMLLSYTLVVIAINMSVENKMSGLVYRGIKEKHTSSTDGQHKS